MLAKFGAAWLQSVALCLGYSPRHVIARHMAGARSGIRLISPTAPISGICEVVSDGA